MANVTVRTISQLPEESTIVAGSYIEMSTPNANGGYTSKKAQFSKVQSTISNSLSTSMAATHGLYNGSTPINLNNVNSSVNNILNGNDVVFSGQKTFSVSPLITTLGSEPNCAATRADCHNFANQYSTGIGQTNKIDNYGQIFINASNDDYRPQYNKASNFYFWHIDDQKTDSSESTNPTTGSIGGYVTINSNDTGMLVICGWLADNGDVSPENAWISLQAKIDNNTKIASIAFQPWIQGKYSNALQYVSFTVPVKSGLQLKIKTGFPVNGQPGGGYQHIGSMTFSDRWIPNAFYGYVIKK